MKRVTLAAASVTILAVLAAACSSTASTQSMPPRSSPPPPAALTASAHSARLTTVATFPAGYFLESLAVRADGSMLVTTVNKKQLWYLPAPGARGSAKPILVHTFNQTTMGIAEAEPDVFYVSTSNLYSTHESSLQRVDLRHWTPGRAAPVQTVLTFDHRTLCLNGTSMLGPNVLLIADCEAGVIDRVDLHADGTRATARVWLQDETMKIAHTKLAQPGVNGVRYDAKTHFVYYTSTAQKLFMRVPVDPATLDPAGAPELVTTGMMADDFCIDENADVAYVTTHRQNTIERVALEPHSNPARQTFAGKPFDLRLIGPASCAWLRGAGDYGAVAYITTDGGFTSPPPDHIVRPARILRAEFS
jgi:hypothetical protein